MLIERMCAGLLHHCVMLARDLRVWQCFMSTVGGNGSRCRSPPTVEFFDNAALLGGPMRVQGCWTIAAPGSAVIQSWAGALRAHLHTCTCGCVRQLFSAGRAHMGVRGYWMIISVVGMGSLACAHIVPAVTDGCFWQHQLADVSGLVAM